MHSERVFDSEKAHRLIGLLKEKGLSVCSCESLTAGLFTAVLGSVPGASAVLAGGLVTYMSIEKEILAHVDHEIIERFGVVSSNCAAAMAENTRKIMRCDYCVSFTGNAGPSALEGKPAGLVYCAIASRHDLEVYEFHMDGTRNEIRMALVDQMINHLIHTVLKHYPDQH